MMLYPEGINSRDQGSSLNGIIFLSLVAHFLILSLLVFSPSLLPASKLTFGPVYSVQLVTMPAGLLEKKSEQTAAREILDYVPARQPMLNKTSLDALPVPIAPVEVRKKSFGSVEKALEAIRKSVPPPAELPVSSPAPQGVSRITSEQMSAAARAGEGGHLNVGMRNYYAVVWSRIKGLWTIPQGILPRENIQAVVHAKILRDGTITNVGLEKRSGNRYFDDSVLRTVKKANPLPPLPEELRDSSIEIGIRFHSSEFK
jgi:colicin import membrane protein